MASLSLIFLHYIYFEITGNPCGLALTSRSLEQKICHDCLDLCSVVDSERAILRAFHDDEKSHSL